MSKLLKKLKPGVRVIDIDSGVEGYVSHSKDIVPNNITVEFEPSVVMSSKNLNVAAISYPISDIENRIKLAPKYGNYKIGDKVKHRHLYKGVVINIDLDLSFPVEVEFEDCSISRYRLDGLEPISNRPILKKLKVKQ
jgi:hypothetical protein